MKRVLKHLPHIVSFLFLLVSVSVFAQQQGSITGGLGGEVTDPTGAVLPDATVTLASPQGTRTLTTDSLGRYLASGLPPGLYDHQRQESTRRWSLLHECCNAGRRPW
jgi:hypothetical protein